MAVAAALSIGLALVIARRNEARIDRMDQVLDAVGAGRMDMRIRDGGRDDLIGMIGFDVGYGFDKLEYSNKVGGWRTHFQFGNMF